MLIGKKSLKCDKILSLTQKTCYKFPIVYLLFVIISILCIKGMVFVLMYESTHQKTRIKDRKQNERFKKIFMQFFINVILLYRNVTTYVTFFFNSLFSARYFVQYKEYSLQLLLIQTCLTSIQMWMTCFYKSCSMHTYTSVLVCPHF